MVIDDFNPLEGKRLEILNEEGKIIAPDLDPQFSDEVLIKLYRNMVISRIADGRAFKLQRSGRMGTFAQVKGQEGAQTGSAYALQKDDWMFPAFREAAAYLLRGCPPHYFYLYNMGNEEGQHLPFEQHNFMCCVPLASQCLHAVGFSWASKMKNENVVTMVYFGDGSTSEGDFHEAMNFAGDYKTPTVFLCQNNQWAISTPRAIQTASKTIAQKAVAYGFKGIQVDGNDVLAMYVAAKEAIDNARNGGGPTLIEAVTYRLGPHTTSDDPTLYRSEEEVQEWEKKDPIIRFRKYIESKGIWDEEKEKQLAQEAEQFTEEAIKKAESWPHPSPKAIFEHTYKEMTPELQEQYEYLMESLK